MMDGDSEVVQTAGDGTRDRDAQVVAARSRVLARVREPAAPGHAGLPTIYAGRPLREPPAAVAARQAARREAGLEADGNGYPRRWVWSRVVVPAGTAAAADLLALPAAAPAGLTAVALAILAVLLAVAAAGYARRDPLRLSEAERRSLRGSRSWQSRQPWIGPLSATAERGLVAVAGELVLRLTASPVWTSDLLDDHRLRLNLAGELDEIDAQAFALANFRRRSDPSGAELDSLEAALVDRVAALSLYADRVTALEPLLAGLAADERASRADGELRELLARSAGDDLAADRLRALAAELDRLGRPDRPGPDR